MSSDDVSLQQRPAEGTITDEGVARLREMSGVKLRPEGPYLQDATPDTLTNFCNGIGDLNPLYRDIQHGRYTRWGSQLGHPCFPYAFGWPGRTRWGLPGVHGFYAGNDWEFFRPIRPGDRVNCVERVVGVEEKESRFSGRLVMQYVEALFTNQRDELIAKTLGWCTRHERRAARETGKYRDVPTQHQYSDEEYTRIDAAVLNEDRQIQGGDVRYWEDVAEGEALPAIARGPLSLMDTMGFLVGCGRGHTHGVVLQSAVRHPGHYFRNPEAGGGVEYTGIGHHRDSVAREVGVPGTYDYGPQRTAWLATLVTNWMGDDAILKRLRGELRRFNVAGDTTWMTGTVSRKYVKDGYALVDIDIVGENQRGELTTKGLATVHLLSRNLNHRVALTGTDINLELPTVR